MNIKHLFKWETTKQRVLTSGYVVSNQALCVQCGICSYNCPIGIDIRFHAWMGEPVKDRRCLTCGECVARCPRGALHFGESVVPASAPRLTEN
jgi:NAD-dependent dihydropyrimidine dehydrogenase PreA subunit